MVGSYSCLRLDNRRVIQVEVYEVDKQKFFFLGNGMKSLFEILKVGQLAELIAHKGKFEASDISKLWKVDVDKSELNPGSTDEDIKKLGGVSMEFEYDFIYYFPNDYEPTRNKIHIIAIVATTTTVSNIPDDYPPKKRPRIIEGEKVTSMDWNQQSDAIKSALIEPPIIIDNGVYSLGESEFKNFVTSGTFVDKSLFIMEFMIYGQRANLITRPRRFGKSTNLSMLQAFLSVDYPPSNYIPDIKNSLFGKLKVAQFKWFAKLYYKRWPVIHISFKDLVSESWEQMQDKIKKRISSLYREHEYIIDFLSENDKKIFVNVLGRETKEVSEATWTSALSDLAYYLKKCFGKSSIILIDEYDWPMENARGFYNKAENFFREMYSSVAKENTYVYKILFVGTLPLGRSSFLSGLNNVVTYPMHEGQSFFGRAVFSDTFGFTEEEIKSLLERKNQSEKLNELRLYYNGYRTSTNVHIYNPHSVISYLLKKNVLDNYWLNSGSAITLVEYLKKCGSGVKDQLHKLDDIIHSHSLRQDQDDSDMSVVGLDVELMPYLRYNDLDTKPKTNAVCTLLYYSGYLTIAPGSLTGHTVKLVIPNREIAYQWLVWIFEVMGMEYTKTNEIYESLFEKDIATFSNKFPSLYMEVVSCFDIGDLKRDKLYETWYHIFVLGALAMYHGGEYRVESNREVGDGRPDVRIIPIVQNKTVSITYEFKRTEDDNSDKMKVATTEALDQIIVKGYRMNLPGHVNEIVEVGIAFCDKVAFVSARCLKRTKEVLTTNEDWEVVSEWETGKTK